MSDGKKLISLAFYQPDIPQNTGAAIRLCACLGVSLHIIRPCGFRWDRKKIRISALDYYEQADIRHHLNWNSFFEEMSLSGRRCITMSTQASCIYTSFTFHKDDVIIAGRESAGLPQDVVNMCAAGVTIPMRGGGRSLNVTHAAAMVAGEALRQTGA